KFWMTHRLSEIGLNVYGNHANDSQLLLHYEEATDRLKLEPEETLSGKLKRGRQYMAESESGWDFSPRYRGNCQDIISIDLNSLLLIMEQNMAYFYNQLGHKHSEDWLEKAKHREMLIKQFCWDPTRKQFVDFHKDTGRSE